MVRTTAAALTGLLAAALLPVSIVSVWVDRVVSDTERYVDTVSPLADDDVVKEAAVTELEREALRLVASSRLPVPAGAADLVRPVVQRAVDSETFRTAWREANRSAHRQLVAVLEDRDGAALDEQGRVVIDLGSVLDTIAQDLARLSLVDPARLPPIRASFAVMDADELARARRAYDATQTLGFWLPVTCAALALVTLLLARRRLATAARLALAALVLVGVLALLLWLARDAVTADLPQRDVARAVWDVVVAGLWRTIWVAAAILAVATVVAGVAGRAWTRTQPE